MNGMIGKTIKPQPNYVVYIPAYLNVKRTLILNIKWPELKRKRKPMATKKL